MLYLGADHNGYFLKEKLKPLLRRLHLPWRDLGAESYVKTDDYVDFAVRVGRAMGKRDFGILICGSGHGMVIAANRLPGIRAILPLSAASARAGRHDDHANILVLAAWHMRFSQAVVIARAFFNARPSGAARYLRRLAKLERLKK